VGLLICKFSEHKGRISLGGSEVVKEFTSIVEISSGLLEDRM